jgi:hypothetical protein
MITMILVSVSFSVGYMMGTSSRDARDTDRRPRMGKADSSWLNKKL